MTQTYPDIRRAQCNVLNGVASTLDTVTEDPVTPAELRPGLAFAARIVRETAEKIAEESA